MKKLVLLGLCLCLGAPMVTEAQTETKTKYKGHYVKTKMKTPRYTRTVSPGTDYEYIKEDWAWNDNANRWDWHGNRWEQRPQPTQKWVAGRWRRTADGWEWVEGHWR